MMKIYTVILFSSLALLSSCATNRIEKLSKDLSLEINTKTGRFQTNRWIHLYVKFKNNSDQDITILKPSTKYGYQIDFFSASMKCEQPSITLASGEDPIINRTETELVTIKSKSSTEFKLSGNLHNLICDSKNIKVEVVYNSEKLPDWIMKKFDKTQKLEAKNMYKKLTKLNVKSLSTEIELK